MMLPEASCKKTACRPDELQALDKSTFFKMTMVRRRGRSLCRSGY